MALVDDVLAHLPDGMVDEVLVGFFVTAVVVTVEGQRRCGLASTLENERPHHSGEPAVRNPGGLTEGSARALAAWLRSPSLTEASIGMAAVNALTPPDALPWREMNAFEMIVRRGRGKRVALVGHFPFVPRLREQVGHLWVLEKRPQEGDLPAEAASDIVPQADVLAMTGMTIVNRTFDALMALKRPDAFVIVLGPSTPLSPALFDYGVDVVSGAVVEHIDPVLRAIREGASFRQARSHSVRLATALKSDVIREA